MIVYRIGHPDNDHQGPWYNPKLFNFVGDSWGSQEHRALSAYFPGRWTGFRIPQIAKVRKDYRSAVSDIRSLYFDWFGNTWSRLDREGYKLYVLDVPDHHVRRYVYDYTGELDKENSPKHQVTIRWKHAKILEVRDLVAPTVSWSFLHESLGHDTLDLISKSPASRAEVSNPETGPLYGSRPGGDTLTDPAKPTSSPLTPQAQQPFQQRSVSSTTG